VLKETRRFRNDSHSTLLLLSIFATFSALRNQEMMHLPQ